MQTRQQASEIVEKLDRNQVSLKVAKEFAKRFGFKSDGRTKEQFIRALFAQLNGETK